MSETKSSESLAVLKEMVEPIRQNRDVLNTLSDEIKAKREAFEASIADLVVRQQAAKEVCAVDESRFREACLKHYQETEEKHFLGIVTIQDRKFIEEYNSKAVGAWIRKYHPGWMIPDFKILEKIVLSEIKGVKIETPLTIGIKPTVAVDMDKVGVKGN